MLKPNALSPLPLTAIRPRGWLLKQLTVQAAGLTGHLDEFWPDVKESGWFGGDSDGWERAPYWLDGLVPLAWLVDDKALQEKAHRAVRFILARQEEDGWMGPHDPKRRDEDMRQPYDIWVHFLLAKVLLQYEDATGDPAVTSALMRLFRRAWEQRATEPLFDWGRMRWFESLVGLYGLYERTGETWLLDLARVFHDQGFDWKAFYAGDEVTVPTPRRGLWTWDKHVVNTAMALKGYPLWWRISGDETDRDFTRRMWEVLDRHHGQATGMFSGDECLSGKNPLQGTELCAVADAMYSQELQLSVLGDPACGDRLERLAFNAWPATLSPDMWSHQYDQQVNQVQCTINPDHLWSTNGADSNLFGLEPNFGCCTANLHQGWPKFAAHLWMATPDGGLAAAAWAPCEVHTKVQDVPVRIEVATEYPFRETIRIVVDASAPVAFPLWLRIPAWAEGARLAIAGREESPVPGTFHVLSTRWEGVTELVLTLPMRAKVTRRFHRSVAVERGPLLYALKLGEEWTRVNADKPWREEPHADYEVTPTTPWNYALQVDEQHPEQGITFREVPAGEQPFSPDGAPMEARVMGRRIPWWKLRNGWTMELPMSPVPSDEPLEELTLIPYGCTNIRLAEFPKLRE